MPFDADSLGIPRASTRLLRDLVHERLGLYFGDDRLDQLADRLAPLLVQRGFGSLLDYYYLLKYDAEAEAEWPRVMDALAVNETYFWREIDQIRAVVDTVVPRLIEATTGAPLQIWSVPCATGEEPLTIAMVLEEAGWFERAPIRIVASDASPAAIEKARRGRYSARAFRNIPDRLRDRYFHKAGDEWLVSDAIHGRITWDIVNLQNPADVARWGASPIVFCRNVFIYFSESSIRRTVDLLAGCMPPGGHLCVGAAESLLRVTNRFDLQEIGGAFMYVRRGGSAEPTAATAAPERGTMPWNA
jgi:chemotaxis protein methyltransferase CheR